MKPRRESEGLGTGSADPVDVAIAKVRMAIAESNNRASKPRSNYASRNNQNKTYKPNGVYVSNLPVGAPTPTINIYGSPKYSKSLDSINYAAGMKETANKYEKKRVAAKSKNTFAKGGVAGVLKSPEAKKFKETFKKKGLIPALRGK